MSYFTVGILNFILFLITGCILGTTIEWVLIIGVLIGVIESKVIGGLD